jgi:hypothetical protein
LLRNLYNPSVVCIFSLFIGKNQKSAHTTDR